jgi:putative transposase
MPYNRRRHHRRSIRLPQYDYTAAGAYFVTVCVHGGESLLGEVVNETMRLNRLGQIAHDFWRDVPGHFPNTSIDAFVIMPNHLHAIIVIRELSAVAGGGEKGEGTSPLQGGQVEKPALGQTVAYYKYQTTKRINQMRDMPGTPFWQRNYWEHVVRNDGELNRIREYIENNPARWAEDQLHPDAPPNRFNQWQPSLEPNRSA